MNHAILLIFAMIFYFHLQQVDANEVSTSISENDYIGDVPMVLSASRLLQPLADAPSAVTIITRETIHDSGVVDLPDIFRLVPGFYVGANAGYVHNTNHVVSYHGMTSAYAGAMQVLINGRSVYTPLYGGVQWSELPLAIVDIERIEVTRGPNAASYGANSYFGVINIITQSPSEAPSNSTIFTHGSGRNEAFYRHAGKINDLSYRATIDYRQDDGLDLRNDFKRTRFLNAQADYQINTANNLEFEFGATEGARGEGEITKDTNIFSPRTKQIDGNYQLVRWRHNISQTSDFSLQAYHAYDRSDDATTVDNVSVLTELNRARLIRTLASKYTIVPNLVENERYDIEAQHNFALGQKIRVVWGGGVRQDSLLAPFYLSTTQTDYFDLQRIFGHVEWQADPTLTVNVGAMLEHNDFTGTDLSPRVSFNFKPTPNHTFRIGASSALRTPNYTEKKFARRIILPTVSGNQLLYQADYNLGNLKPEQIVSREIVYLGKVDKLNWDIKIFQDNISDYINARRARAPVQKGFNIISGRASQRFNDGSAEINGYETQINWQFVKSTNILLNYAFVKIRQTKAKLATDFVDSAPRNTVSTLITHQLDANWDASFAYYQTSAVSALGDGDPVGLIRKSDVRVTRKLTSSHLNGEASVIVDNVFNNHYHEFAEYNTLKRRAYFNVVLNF